MSPGANALAAACVTLSLVALSGCDDETPPPPSAAPPVVSAAPVDQIKPGELGPGRELAFGFPIPKGMRVRERRATLVEAEGIYPMEQIANYVRDEADVKKVETGPSKTVFTSVIVDANPDRRLTIEVSQLGSRTTLRVIDATPRPPAERVPGLSEEQRWNRVGLTKDGKPADPKSFE